MWQISRRPGDSPSSNYFPFLLQYVAHPRRVGAIAPSGQTLARLITSEITADSAPVIELGPGTGAFTRALIQRGLRQEDLTLIELGSDFARHLQLKFPSSRVLWMDARRLHDYALFKGSPVGAVISGLPFLNMNREQRESILSGCFKYMRPNSRFYQFSYGITCPIPHDTLDRLGLEATLVGRALWNIPPAAVYRIHAPAAPSRAGAGPLS